MPFPKLTFLLKATYRFQRNLHPKLNHPHNKNTLMWLAYLLEMVLHQLQISIVTLMQLSRAVLWTKNSIWNVRNERCAIEYTVMYQFFYTSSKTFRISIITLWIRVNLCVFNNSLMALRNNCNQSLDNNLSVKKRWWKVWPKVPYFVIWNGNGNLFHLYISCLHKVWDQDSFNLIKVIYTNEAGVR